MGPQERKRTRGDKIFVSPLPSQHLPSSYRVAVPFHSSPNSRLCRFHHYVILLQRALCSSHPMTLVQTCYQMPISRGADVQLPRCHLIGARTISGTLDRHVGRQTPCFVFISLQCRSFYLFLYSYFKLAHRRFTYTCCGRYHLNRFSRHKMPSLALLAIGAPFLWFALRAFAAYFWPSAESKALPPGKASQDLALTEGQGLTLRDRSPACSPSRESTHDTQN